MNDLVRAVCDFARSNLGAKPEYIFASHPEFAVFRAGKKWFGVLMKIEASRLNSSISGQIWLLNVKCEPDLAAILRDERQILSAYHMNKRHWISLNLSSNIDEKLVCDLLKESFCKINKKGRK